MGEIMEEESRSRRKRKKRRSKSSRKGCFLKGCLGGLLLLLLIVGGVAFFIYRDLRNTTDEMYTEIEQEQHESRENPVNVDSGEEPFSILVLGVDQGEFGRDAQGRSDTLMLMTINPNSDQIHIVSIPRDTYTEIVGEGIMDKINHAYAFGGTSMTINTVQNLFDVPIDYYVSVNMASMQQIIDSVGGITVTPPFSFTYEGYSFVGGQSTNLDGSQALAYSRMRYDDPDGDYGRQERQREVMEATISRVASFDSVTNYRNILQTLGSNAQTNMSFDDMYDMFNNYRQATNTIEQVQLRGTGQMISGVYYEMIPDEEVARVSNILKNELEID